MGAYKGGSAAAKITTRHADVRADFDRRLNSYRDFAATADNYLYAMVNNIFPEPGLTPLERDARIIPWAEKLNAAVANLAIEGSDEAYVAATKMQAALNHFTFRAAQSSVTLEDMNPINAEYCRASKSFVQQVRSEIGRHRLLVDVCAPPPP